MGQVEMYETITGEMLPVKKKKTNPLLKAYGPGPEGKKCGQCEHHYFKRMSKSYPKCALRKNTCGPKTDHSSRFPACGKFILENPCI